MTRDAFHKTPPARAGRNRLLHRYWRDPIEKATNLTQMFASPMPSITSAFSSVDEAVQTTSHYGARHLKRQDSFASRRPATHP